MTQPAHRPMRDLYERYVAGKVSWDEVKRETDRAAEAYERDRGRRPDGTDRAPTPPPDAS